jgi:hypothetical protein
MPLEVMETVPEFRRIIEMLKELDRFELVWAVCGGNPALMVTLMQKSLPGARLTPKGRLTAESARELGAAVDEFALERVRQAVGQVTELKTKHPQLKELLEMFQTVDKVTTGVMSAKEFVRPHDDKVLRTADTSGVLIPANAATALVLRHGLEDIPTIEELRELVGQVRYACDCVGEPSGDSIRVTFQPLTLHLSCALPTPVLHRRPRKIEVQRMREWQRHTLLKGVEAMLLEEDSKAPSDFLEQCRCSYSRSAPIAHDEPAITARKDPTTQGKTWHLVAPRAPPWSQNRVKSCRKVCQVVFPTAGHIHFEGRRRWRTSMVIRSRIFLRYNMRMVSTHRLVYFI